MRTIELVAETKATIDNNLAAVKDHSRVFSDFTFVYPVISRRSRGLSLGVNLNPDKVCNFDCIYCEVDRRTPGKAARIDVQQMSEELIALIGLVRDGGLRQDLRYSQISLAMEIRDIAFSGDGEPTMIPNFAECVQAVAEVKKSQNLPETKIVLITDAAGLDKTDVQIGLKIMDANQGEVWGKLDAGTEDYFKKVNRSYIRFERILNNLLFTSRVRPIVIQSLFLKVHGEIMPVAELEAYCDRLHAMVKQGGRVKEVHAYTIARPTPEPYATRLEAHELDTIAGTIRQGTHLPVLTFP